MQKSNVKVEQVYCGGVVEDYGEILSPKEITDVLLSYFPNAKVDETGNIYGTIYGKDYCVFPKNISYLGIPHPIYKKRIQIPNSFLDLYNKNKRKGITTLLIGIYSYRDTLLFCDFDTSKYVYNKINNSSAHVYTIDLLNGYRNGLFKKKDNRQNIITVFNKNNIEDFLNNKIEDNHSSGVDVFDTLDEFFSSMYKEWYGLECYAEMIEKGFNNKHQPEWPGFYLEFKLKEYLETHEDKMNIIKYVQNKKQGDIDLDLYFPKLKMYGDLKMHSNLSGAIQGNDYQTIMDITDEQSIYYVVCNHETVKDKDKNYEVTEYWNNILNKDDKRSYGSKMKNSVRLTSYYILEINKYNREYLTQFNQGKNSDGSPREPKIMISNKNINNFLVHVVEFEKE